jgi:BirA family transcriptional regulator, biotin operon repressor / biotin---[acetyl-CoA-carboxylase] ligase
MSLKYQLIQLLADGKFHSGEELGNKLQVSRSAIWKTLHDFTALGIEVHRIKGKGYQLSKKLELLDLDHLNALIAASIKQYITIEILTEIDSTNRYLLSNLPFKTSGTIVFAEHQTHGRGRLHRKWFSPFGANIYFSILWSFDKDPSELKGLSLAAGIAVVNTLERYGITQVQLKWPNDILWQNKKLAGVLIEMTAETHACTQIVLGIGLNLQMPNFANIDQEWIDVASICHRKLERNLMASLLIEEVVEMLQTFAQKGFANYFKHWQALDASFGKPVKLLTTQQTFEGTSNGINRQGEFILVDTDGKERRFLQGDVSLRW